MKLDNIILNEVTQTQKDNYHVYSLIVHKAKKTSLQTTFPVNLDNNEDTKKDLHRSNLQGK